MPSSKSVSDDSKASSDHWQEIRRRRLCERFKITPAQLYALDGAEQKFDCAPCLPLYIVSRGLPVTVALHAVTALRVFGIKTDGVEYRPWSHTPAEMTCDANTLLQLRLAELAGKIAALSEAVYPSYHFAISKMITAPDLSFAGSSIKSAESGVETLGKLARCCVQWSRWECFQDLVKRVEDKTIEALESLSLPERLRGKQPRLLPMEHGDVFDDYRCSNSLAAAMRKAEGAAAVYEELDLERVAKSWLFQSEIHDEIGKLREWTQHPALIQRVKSRLASLIEGLPTDWDSEDGDLSNWIEDEINRVD